MENPKDTLKGLSDPIVSTYNPEEHNKSQQQYIKSQMEHRQTLLNDTMSIVNKWEYVESIPISTLMDMLEKLLYSCGGESKGMFVAVSYRVIIMQTRVPITAKLYGFLPDGDDNPPMHQVFIKTLMKLKCIQGVRWVPSAEGSQIVVDLV